MAPIPGQGTKIPLASEQLSICANYWAFALRACATTRVHVPRQKIPGAATKSQCSQTNKHFSKRKENGAYPIPTQCDFHMYYFQPLHLSIPDNFSSSPYLWLYCSLFPRALSSFVCFSPTQCLLQMPDPPKYSPDFPDGTISSVSKLLSHTTLPSAYLCMIQNSSWCIGTNMGFVFTSLSSSLHPTLLCPLNPSTALISLAAEFQTHCSVPLQHETSVRQTPPCGWGVWRENPSNLG